MERNMSDLISRQAAIDAMKNLIDSMIETDTVGFYEIENVLFELPSAQPEIIRCKDCRWGRKVCGNIECFVDRNTPPEYHGYEWFCPNGERTDGESE